jgi:hypothetical protein
MNGQFAGDIAADPVACWHLHVTGAGSGAGVGSKCVH